MEISYVLTEQDFIDVQRAHAWRKYKPSTLQVFTILNPAIGLLLMGEAWWLISLGFRISAILLLLGGIYLVLARGVISPWLWRRAYRRRQHGPPHEMTMTITDDAAKCDCRGRSHSTLEWPMIVGMLDSKTTLLLYASRATFLYIPKRVLDNSQLEELRSILIAKGIPAGPPRAARLAADPHTA